MPSQGWQSLTFGTLRVAKPLFRMLHALRHALTRVGKSTTHPGAFAVVAVYAVAWLIFSPDAFRLGSDSDVGDLAGRLFSSTAPSTVDTQAIGAKIDELLRTQGKARAELTTSGQARCRGR